MFYFWYCLRWKWLGGCKYFLSCLGKGVYGWFFLGEGRFCYYFKMYFIFWGGGRRGGSLEGLIFFWVFLRGVVCDWWINRVLGLNRYGFRLRIFYFYDFYFEFVFLRVNRRNFIFYRVYMGITWDKDLEGFERCSVLS